MRPKAGKRLSAAWLRTFKYSAKMQSKRGLTVAAVGVGAPGVIHVEKA